MSVWKWLNRSATGDARPGSPDLPSSARVVVEIAERVRSVDGLNSWQREQVREMVREEIAALLPVLIATTHPTPPPPRGDGPLLPTLPLGRDEADGSRACMA
jgi:hypothetical protein